jgi:hypothetical protein
MRRLEPASPTIHHALILALELHRPQSRFHDGVRPVTSRRIATACSRVSSNIPPAPNKNTGPLSCRCSVVANIKWCNIRLGCAIERRSSHSQTLPVYLRGPANEALDTTLHFIQKNSEGFFEGPHVVIAVLPVDSGLTDAEI